MKPLRIWGLSSVGRASALHAEGREFDSHRLHDKPEVQGIETSQTPSLSQIVSWVVLHHDKNATL